jgi:hypothetical protein
MATLPTLDHFQDAPEVRPFPPPALPGFVGTTSLSATPHGPAWPSRAAGWEVRLPPLGFPVLRPISVCRQCRRHYPGGTTGEGESFPGEPVTAAFPVSMAGRLPHQTFRGLLGVHSRYGLPARGAASTALSIRSFGSIVPSTAVPIATGWNDSCRVGIAPTEDRRLGTAHTDTSFFAVRALLS